MSLPPLPQIEGNYDLILDVHTHRNLRPYPSQNDSYGTVDRLAALGSQVLNMVVTNHFFLFQPLLPAGEIGLRREQYTSPAMLDSWLTSYNLKERLRVPPDQSDAILGDLNEMAFYFHSYLGAVFYRSGLAVVQSWISRLIDPDTAMQLPRSPVQQVSFGQDGRSVMDYTTPSSYGHQINEASSSSSLSPSDFFPAPPTGPPPPLPSGSSTPFLSLVTLALVNQTAAQKGCSISYPASQQGPPHQPTWTVKCVINGVDKGIGVGKSQKFAKEEAARQAWVAMRWPG